MFPARSCVYTISLAFSTSSRYRSSLACSTSSTYLRLVMSQELITTPATAAAMYLFIRGPPFPPPIGKETGLYKENFYRVGRTSPTTVPEVRSLVAEHALSRPRSPLPKPATDAWQLGQGRPRLAPARRHPTAARGQRKHHQPTSLAEACAAPTPRTPRLSRDAPPPVTLKDAPTAAARPAQPC